MKADLYKNDGTTNAKAVNVPADIFGIEPSDDAIYMDVKSVMTNSRQGIAATKNRSMVRGGGKKPWKQKGRGVARAGTIRSPIWRGGGTIFGPQPRNFHMKVNKKVKALARKSAYSYKMKEGSVRIIEDLKMENPKTKDLFDLLKSWDIESKKITVLLSENKKNVWLSGRNIPNVSICLATNASTYDLLDNEILLVENDAIKKLQEVFA